MLHPECRIAHERDVHAVHRRAYHIIADRIEMREIYAPLKLTGNVLRKFGAIPERLTNPKRMEIPIRTSRPAANERVIAAQRSLHKYIRAVPVAKEASEDHAEEGLRAG